MSVYRDGKSNTWRVIYRYTDWTGHLGNQGARYPHKIGAVFRQAEDKQHYTDADHRMAEHTY